MGLIEIDQVRYMLAGSKNTCLIWPADTPSREYFATTSSTDVLTAVGSDIAPNVAALFSIWYLAKSLEEQTAMFEDWCHAGMCTIMGELNRPWAEHLIPIKTLFLEVPYLAAMTLCSLKDPGVLYFRSRWTPLTPGGGIQILFTARNYPG